MANVRRIGVAPFAALSQLKRYALIFDSVVLPTSEPDEGDDRFDRMIFHSHPWPPEFEWLYEQGVLATWNDEVSRWSPAHVPKQLISAMFQHERNQRLVDIPFNVPVDGWNPENVTPTIEAVDAAYKAVEDMEVSFFAGALRSYGAEAVALIPVEANETTSAKGFEDVVQLVVDQLPMPSNATSWDQIIEFRQDPRIRQHFDALQNWMRKAALGEMSMRDLAGEIEASTITYERYMANCRVRSDMATVETVIKIGAGAFVAGIGLNEIAALVGAAGAICATIRRRRAEMYIQEAIAPGAELAFITKVKERF